MSSGLVRNVGWHSVTYTEAMLAAASSLVVVSGRGIFQNAVTVVTTPFFLATKNLPGCKFFLRSRATYYELRVRSFQ